LILKFITDDAARMAAVMAGEVDIASNVPPFRVEELKANKNLNVRIQPSSRTHYLVLDTTKKPFDNVKVRQAVSLAIDRAALVRAVQNGNGIPLPSVWMPLSFGYNPNIKAEYNVDKAKALLKEAGYPDGFDVQFDSFTGSITDHSKTAEAVAGMLAKVGIRCKLNITEQAVFGPLRLANKTAPIYNYSFGDQYFDHGVNMGTFVSGAQGYYYTDKALSDKIAKALAEFDTEKRKVIFMDIQKDFYDLAFMPGLYNMSQIWVTTQAVDWVPPTDEIWRFHLAKPTK
jgi:peptide/nickel transport system substrate-binding protein